MTDHETTKTSPSHERPKVPGVLVLFENGRTAHRILRGEPIRIESGDTWIEVVPDEHHERGGVIVSAYGDFHALAYDGLDDAGCCTVIRVGDTIAALHRNVLRLDSVATLENVDYPLPSRAYSILQRDRTNRALLLTGAAGTDKVRIARAIHRGGARADRPFVHLTPESLHLRSEPSFEERGAAIERFLDALLTANGGTVVLENFDRFPFWLHTIGDYLRMPGDGTIRVGGSKSSSPLDLEIILAFEREHDEALFSEIGARGFPGSVWDHAWRLHIPAMTELWPSVPTYVQWAARNSRVRLSAHFVEACIQRPWPGNQEELFAAVAAALADAEASGKYVLWGEDVPEWVQDEGDFAALR